MKKGYWVAAVDIADATGYQGYITGNKAVFEKYGARFLVRNGEKSVMEGAPRSRIVVIEFESYARALECYRSPDRKSTRLNSSHVSESRMPSSA